MKKKALMCGIIIMFIISIVACDDSDDTKYKSLESTDVRELTLSELWSSVIEITDIQESSANLEYLRMSIDSEFQIDHLHCIFHGRNYDGYPNAYFVNIDSRDRLSSYQSPIESVFEYVNPATLFTEIDTIGLTSMADMEMGEHGVTLSIRHTWGSIGYTRGYADLYELNEAELIPFDKVIFHTNNPVTTIELAKLKSGVLFPTIIFLPWDLADADEIEYSDDSHIN